MATRVRIAAAACVVASGLFVGSASVTTAFADPASGQGVDDGPAQASASPSDAKSGSAPSSSPVASTERAAGGNPTAEAADPAAVHAVEPKPRSTVGDGRHGLGSERSGGGAARPVPSKQPEMDRRRPPQTPPKEAGEPETPDGPAAEDPTKPDDPKEHRPGFGWPWWGPCPHPHGPHDPKDPHDPDDPDDPDDPGPGLPPGNSGGGGGGTQPKPPSGRPEPPPQMQLPPPREVPPELPNISVDPAVDAATGFAAGAELPLGPITLPIVVAPLGVGGIGQGGGTGGSAAGPRAGTPSAPRGPDASQNTQPAPKAGQPNPPAFSAGNGAPPASFRVGYGNYLRSANVGQIMAVAIPGVAGILILTGAGGLLGFRQARAGRAVRASGTARFMG